MNNTASNPDRLIPGIDTYPDLGPPEVMPEGYKTIKALPGYQSPAPNISWGDKFEEGHPDEKPKAWQLRRVKKVANAMNHAADIMQQRVSELIDVANHQERQLALNKQDFANQQQTMILSLTRHNEQQQARMQEAQDLKAELRDAKRRIKELESAE